MYIHVCNSQDAFCKKIYVTLFEFTNVSLVIKFASFLSSCISTISCFEVRKPFGKDFCHFMIYLNYDLVVCLSTILRPVTSMVCTAHNFKTSATLEESHIQSSILQMCNQLEIWRKASLGDLYPQLARTLCYILAKTCHNISCLVLSWSYFGIMMGQTFNKVIECNDPAGQLKVCLGCRDKKSDFSFFFIIKVSAEVHCIEISTI